MKRILLVRHGRSAHLPLGICTGEDCERWLVEYDLHGLIANETAPAELRELAKSALVVSSDYVRAVESARLITDRDFPTTPLLRELRTTVPRLGGIRLHFRLWGLIWILRTLFTKADIDPEALARADEAAAWLEERAREHDTIVAVTHFAFRRLLADALAARGWHREPRHRGHHHFGAWELTRR
jgi:broad specificity phosphatase PhoE